MKSIQQRFGAAVRRLREAAGFSQESFAQEAGIARSYMGFIERGKVNPTLASAQKIAETLNLTLGQLMIEVDAEH